MFPNPLDRSFNNLSAICCAGECYRAIYISPLHTILKSVFSRTRNTLTPATLHSDRWRRLRCGTLTSYNPGLRVVEETIWNTAQRNMTATSMPYSIPCLKNSFAMKMIFEGFNYLNNKEMWRFWRSCTVVKLSAETLAVKLEFNYFNASK